MFMLNALPRQLPAKLVALMEQVETATIGHILHSGFVDPAIRAVLPHKRVAGTAVTLRIPGADSTLLHHVLSLVRPGDFLVIDRCGDTRHACWGGVVTNAAKASGVVGSIIDGPATDFSEIRRCDMPVWCRGPSPITTKLLGLEGAFNVPVTVGGQTICPGDAILADESGVLVLKPDEAEAICSRAIGMQEREITLLNRIHKGEKLADISGATRIVEEANRRVAAQ
ncbi:RraA family protein [Chelatococcus sp. SYSU_G07232]|uniref:Putative 4-hydroxy-4-methyl-2-oxoglutarate aldolase n=1 Tax=Chelatococcus albus TaxID=3047466 RepID=A0ABT7AE29_9HYPH|nr:RraA family protein [Chelatococcus sp. SYSU_G07232]MDJ1157634.1 RraA family protein [Chelatococcus sp. SYSU_G07232]